MSCFGGQTSPDLFQNCCNANTLCEFDGNLDDVVSEPIFVQKVFDAVLFNLQGLKTVTNQSFCPAIPRGHRLKKIIDIRCRKFFNPENVEDPSNLRLNINTVISGGTFIQNCKGEDITVVGPDGTFSERIIYADTQECDSKGKGTPIFGTQNVTVTGDVQVYLDLLLCDRYDHEVVFTVSTNVNIAQDSSPLLLTNFFELCIPSTQNSAFLPRFAEFCNPLCETRLATNNMGRDLIVCPDGTIKANLIIALCITCEKKIVVPVQLCVLSTGYVQLSPQVSAICTNFPQLFPDQLQEEEEESVCKDPCHPHHRPCPPQHDHSPYPPHPPHHHSSPCSPRDDCKR
ncbi:MAG: hypothetical protein ACOX4P_06040 [Anaerovoracaceae bacterium]|jgi:hypothetical protein